MRAALLLVVFAVGCGGKKDNGTPSDPSNTPKSSEKTEDPKPKPHDPAIPDAPELEIASSDLMRAYKDNPVAADAKYKGKRIAVKTATDVIRQTEAGPVVGKRYTDSDTAEPTLFFHFPQSRAGEVAKMGHRQLLTVSGVCQGRKDDGIRRVFPGWEFRVDLTDCRVHDWKNWALKQ